MTVEDVIQALESLSILKQTKERKKASAEGHVVWLSQACRRAQRLKERMV